MMIKCLRGVLVLMLVLGCSSLMTTQTLAQALAQTPTSEIGIVIMHGKGGAPTNLVADLATALSDRGYRVSNLEMPWSGRRNYDVSTRVAEQEVETALAALRAQGARRIFIAGHSQGGLFALHLGSKVLVDGMIVIAPGGDVSSAFFQSKVGASVSLARTLIAAGKGEERASFLDFEGSKGTSPVVTTATVYFDWFDPDGVMNQARAVKIFNARIPVLYIAPQGDYPALVRANPPMYAMLPSNPQHRFYTPDTNHRNAPSASIDEIVRWMTVVAQ